MSARRPARIGRYEVLDRLGSGGMGAVYLASDPLLGRTVAVKVLRSDDDELRERFAREARSAASLKHHHIVTIYDIGEDDEGRPFLAMEYIDGESMAELIRRRAQIALHQRLKYIIDLCHGLGHAHRAGIVHRDIKPANLMITSEGVLKVVDFGLARVVESSAAGLTRAGTLLGTVHYMSPEQVDGTTVDHLSDIFSVGLVLYEIIAYRKAYPGDSAPVVLHNIVHTNPAPIGDFLPERDEELEWVVAKAIEKPRPRRFQDLRELAGALESVRGRLAATDPDATIVQRPETPDASRRSAITGDTTAQTEVSPNALPPSPRPHRTDPRHLRNLDAIAQRRAAQIAQFLAAAAEHFAAGRHEAAVEQCEAALLINPDESRALQLLEQAHQALNDRQVNQWVTEAKAHLSRGDLTQAEELVDQALQLRSDSPDAMALRNQVRQTRRERERAADRARAVEAAVERARRSLQAGALEAAVRAANEALAYDSGQRDASSLREQALAGLEARRRQQEHEQAAVDVCAKARDVADAGDHSAALELLRGFSPPHPAVNEAIAEIEERIAALERQRREEIERARLRALEESRRREQLASLRSTTSTALERGDYAAARAAVRIARSQPLVPGDADLERLCAEIDIAIDAAEAAARLRKSIDRHLKSAQEAIAAGDLSSAGKSVDAAISLGPDDAEAQRLQRHVRELKAAAAAAEAAAERRATLERQVNAAQAALAKGDLAAAARLVDAALKLAPEDQDVLRLQQKVGEEQAARQREEQQRREAADCAARAREWFAASRAEEAFRLLAAFEPHALVAAVEQELRARQELLERQARERQERERQERERQERERLERERQERERQERARQAREQEEQARQERERQERERQEHERQERERLERERQERARQARERQEQERQAREREEQERKERERQEQERQARERQEQERREQERKERERQERARQEQERQARERQEQERREQERQERDREKRERKERERQEREAAARAKAEERERRAAARAAQQAAAAVHPAIENVPSAEAAPSDRLDLTRVRSVAPIAAGVVLVLAIGGGWWALRDRTPDSPAPAPPTPAPVSYAKELAAAREQFRSGDLVGAVRATLAIPSSAPESNEATALLGEIRGEAQTRSQGARLSAEQGGQAKESSFGEAAARDAEAANLTRPEDVERAVALYEEAAALYRKAATAGASAAEILQLARAEIKANRIRPAVAYAMQVLDTNPRHAEAIALLRTTREQAQKLTQTAAADARRIGLSSDNSPAFKDAAAQESAAAQLTGPRDTLRAYDGFLSAAARYREASAQFTADNARRLADAGSARAQAEQRLQSGDVDGAAAAIQQAERLDPNASSLPALRKRLADLRASRNAAVTNAAEIDQGLTAAAKVSDDLEALKMLADLAARYPNDPRVDSALRSRRQARDNRIADLVRRAQPAADAQALELLDEALRLDPSRRDLVAERDRRRAAAAAARVTDDVRNVVARLEAAYESGNVADIVRIAPVMDRARLEAQFKSASIQWDVEPCTVRVDPNGTTANATCLIQETLRPIGIRAPQTTTRQTRHFVLTNVDGTWRITAQQIQ
jgi:serine/threonine protein kinase